MNHTIYMAYAGLRGRSQALDVLSNNLSNLTAPGFKRDQVYFNVLKQMGGMNVTELERLINGPVVEARSTTDFSVGSLTQTGNPLHLALATQEGFFVVETPQGLRYTRNGGFGLDEKGGLITAEGFPVLGQGPDTGKPLVLPEGTPEISPNGDISVNGMVAGRLMIVHFKDLAQLRKAGSTLFEAPPGAEQVPPSSILVRQGYLEQANVNPIESVTEMISLLRNFEMLSQAIRSISNNVDRKVIDEIGKI